MAVFVDTSALFAFLNDEDPNYALAHQIFVRLREVDEWLFTHDYVVVETVALLQARTGLGPVRRLRDEILPALTVTWVDADLHRTALDATLAGTRNVSLVDHTSFALMRRRNIRRAFAFDEHFAQAGFELEGTSP
ncbi:MAG: PIN domain-containing protein [Actinomycetota bacterium]|nr:PIN domain-containing protein [Actinomycetota bacterium]